MLLLTGCAWASVPPDVVYPSDAGVVNVKTAYGAKGDGVTDDTNAILTAIQQNVGAANFGILYFPSGTYLVSQQLPYLDSNGWWGAFLTLQGQSESNTIIKLMDNAPGFQDPVHPLAVIYTASNNGDNNPADTANYNPCGCGNEGFRNHIMNLTVDTGSNNPGAIAIDYMANNNTRISDVTVMSEDGGGVFGINIQRGFPGPMYLKNIQINGFATAIAIANSYGVWMEHVTLAGQTTSGIDVYNGSASIRDLNSTDSVPAVRVPYSSAVVSLVDANLTGGSAAISAIQVAGGTAVFLRNISTQGYLSALNQAGAEVFGGGLTEWTTAGATSLFSAAAPASLDLPVQETPTYSDNDFSNWANVVTYGAQPNNPNLLLSTHDSAPGIQAAIDSGYSTVYLPPGNYMISQPIYVRGAVQRILGLSAYLMPLDLTYPQNLPAIQVDTTSSGTVFIDNVGISQNYWVPSASGLQTAVFAEDSFLNNSSGTLVLTNVDYFGYLNTPAASNSTVFLESVYGISGMTFTNQTVFARNLDPENASMEPHVQVSGGTLWTLGLKTEGIVSPVVANKAGAQSEFLGLAAGVFTDVPASVPMMTNQDASFSVEAFRTNPFAEPNGASDYDVLAQETLAGVTKSLFRAGSGKTPTVPVYGYGSADSLFTDAEASPFADVAPSDYYATAVAELYFRNVTTGCAASPLLFCPENPVTRAQMAIFLVRSILGGDPEPGTYSSVPYFTDVAPGAFGFSSIQKLYELGVTGGCGAAVYCPNDSVTRAEMAVFIIRARYGSLTEFSFSATPYFADVPQSGFGFDWIQRLKQDNITSGCTATDYCPDETITRGDMAILIMRGLFNQLLPAETPLIGYVSQSALVGGASATLTVTGVGTHFVQGTTVMNGVTGLIAGPVTVMSANTLTVPVTAQSGFAQPVSVWVTTGNEDAILPNGLVIQ